MASLGAGTPVHASDDAELFPNIHVNVQERYIELDGHVPIRLDDPDAPLVYLELVACTPNTKEHEVLVVTPARPSQVHAALLMIGLKPGKPAFWTQENGSVIAHAPQGDPVKVELLWQDDDGNQIQSSPANWIVSAQSHKPWPEGQWVFAGSIMNNHGGHEFYEADGSGTLIGLTSFGSEVIAWQRVISPDSQTDEPEWIANAEHVPPVDTAVTIRISALHDK